MSLDITLTAPRPTSVFEWNITHNLGPMAAMVGAYELLWRPDEIGIRTANDAIIPLGNALSEIRARKSELERLNPANGWGKYENLLEFVENYLDACVANPDATISACR